MFSAASVCLSVCLFVCLFICQHDNFRTIKLKRMMMKLNWRLGALYKNLAKVRMSRSKVKVTGDKKRKMRHFVPESSSGARSSCGIF